MSFQSRHHDTTIPFEKHIKKYSQMYKITTGFSKFLFIRSHGLLKEPFLHYASIPRAPTLGTHCRKNFPLLQCM